MEEHETRRKIIRQWTALPKDKRQTEEQVSTFAKKGSARKPADHRAHRAVRGHGDDCALETSS